MPSVPPARRAAGLALDAHEHRQASVREAAAALLLELIGACGAPLLTSPLLAPLKEAARKPIAEKVAAGLPAPAPPGKICY